MRNAHLHSEAYLYGHMSQESEQLVPSRETHHGVCFIDDNRGLVRSGLRVFFKTLCDAQIVVTFVGEAHDSTKPKLG